MKTPFCLSAAAAFACLSPAAELPRATPESQGVASAALQALVDELEARAFGVHSLVIVRHGRVIAEGWWAPYAPDEPHMLFSLSKSFTSTAIGLLQAEGRLSIDDPVLKYFPEDAPAQPSENLRQMRIRDLLRMTTGQHQPDIGPIPIMQDTGVPATRAFLAAPVPHKPGTHFFYNSHATFMLSAIVQKVSGQTMRDYLVPRLFQPLGIPTPDWDATPQGFSFGASGLHLRTGDIAKFGQLYLQRGEWEGRRLLPAAWIDEATAAQTSNGSHPDSDWDQGYGYQFWRCIPGFYRADGANGQFCIVMPQHDTVVAINSGTRDMAGIMKTLWRLLLPELRPAALPENPTAAGALRRRLGALARPFEKGAATSPIADRVLGKRFAVTGENAASLEAVSLERAPDGATVALARIRGRDIRIPVGHGAWRKTEAPFGPTGAIQPVASSGGWIADDTFVVAAYYYRTPRIEKLRLKFSGDEVAIEASSNLDRPVHLTGRAQP
ncbi:MAG TPA: serine hydrolase [Opitutaceae bacterium]|nr:serine hydrolase [Opitutaceae bacterium]